MKRRDSIVIPLGPLSLSSAYFFVDIIHGYIDASSESMSSKSKSSGLVLEKFPDAAPPSIEVTSPQEVIDAGLRSLDHCE